MTPRTRLRWTDGTWLNRPPHQEHGDDVLHLIPDGGTDYWRHTSYGFVHHNGPALVRPLPVGTAMEVSFEANYTHQFDQAGVLVHTDEANWVKAGLEKSDGVLQLGAVATDGRSDWSASPVHGWGDDLVTIRVSRGHDSLTVRARRHEDPWQLVRLTPFDGGHDAAAGPFACAPTRSGLRVTFHGWWSGPADAALHHDDQS